MARCVICGCEIIEEDDIHTAFGEIHCADCFAANFSYCSRCDELIDRDSTNYDISDNPYCSECFDNVSDELSPDNPDVFESDRKFVVQLSRNWLSGNCNHKKLIWINKNDSFLEHLREITGLIESNIYVFGLMDRDEYQVLASPDVIDDVKEFVMLNGLDIKISAGTGDKRLGISLSLRKENLQLISNLIKNITTTKELVTI